MRSSSLVLALSALSSSIAAPLEKRSDYNPPPKGDIDILNYALTLEYLERKFYQEGLANYTEAQFCSAGFDTAFYNNLKQVYVDEQSHVAFLSSALGSAAVGEATYSFPVTDAKSFVALAAVLEGVGVSAYLGAAAVIANKKYLTVAGSILTVEARHASYIRSFVGDVPFAKPYDTPLDFNQVFSLAAQFITGNAPALPFKAFPPLMLQASQYPYTEDRSSVTFHNAYTNAMAAGLATASTKVYAVFFSGLDTYYEQVYIPGGNRDYKVDKIPGPNYTMAGELPPLGQTYVVLSTADGTGNNTVSDENTISGVGILEVLQK